METKEQFQKILQWMKQMSGAMEDLREGQNKLWEGQEKLKRELTARMDISDERFDSWSGALQAMLKAMRGLRVEQFNDRTRFDKEIQKLKQEMRESRH